MLIKTRLWKQLSLANSDGTRSFSFFPILQVYKFFGANFQPIWINKAILCWLVSVYLCFSAACAAPVPGPYK